MVKDIETNDKRTTKLVRAIGNLGLSWTAYSGIVDVAATIAGVPVKTAVWYYHIPSKKERIAIDPEFIDNHTAGEISIAIKHELLHKALYRNINAKNKILENVALDCCVNKVLAMSQPKAMVAFCKKFYNQDRISPLAMGNCSLTDSEFQSLEKQIKAIWAELYCDDDGKPIGMRLEQGKCLNDTIPEPMTIYNKLVLTLTKDQKEAISEEYSYAEKKPENEKGDKSGNDEGAEGDPQEDSDNEEEKNNEEESEQEDKGDESEDEGDGNSDEGNEEDEPQEDMEESDGEAEEESDTVSSEDDSGNNEDDVNEEDTDNNDESDSEDSQEEDGSEEDDEEEDSGMEADENAPTILVRGGGEGKMSPNPQDRKDEVGDIKKIFGNGYSHGSDLYEILKNGVYNPESADTRNLKDFVATWHTMRQIEGIEASIYSQIASNIRFDPYPDSLSRTGLEYVALGVSGPDAIPLYLNANDKTTCKKKVACYFDVSPSMTEFIPYMVHVAEFFSNLEETMVAGGPGEGHYTFSGDVHAMTHEEWEKFRRGEQVGCGWSTSFKAVVRHFIDMISEEDADICVIFTDGESSVGDELIQEFNQTNRKCYRIYFTNGRMCYGIEKDDQGNITSDLDNLTGDSFTVTIDKSKK